MPAETAEEQRRRRELWALVGGSVAALRLTRFAGDAERATALDDLAALLFTLNRAAYEQSLTRAVVDAGGDPNAVALTNRAVLADLRAAAEASAKTIAETYAADLQRLVAAMPADTAPHDLAALIRRWDALRSDWKAPQIARTESATAAGRAVRDVGQRSRGTRKAYFGGSLQCTICQTIAGNNPYEPDDPFIGSLGHPNCLDVWWWEWTSVDDLWTGA